MCGITGFIDKKITNKNKVIKDMADIIKHRGPDSEGYYIDTDIAIGFRRLSIIDLENGNEPIYNEDKTKLITFNGEIYNYKYLKEDLIEKGHIFTTNTDTEVILHGYEEYKEDILPMLRGMFSFIIYDIKKKELFGARDFYGIKPFYYYHKGRTFMFSSEIKSFLANPNFEKELNKDMLEKYLSFQYSVTEETFFKHVYKLPQGHYFKYKNDTITIKKYYELELENNNNSLESNKTKLNDLVNDSIKVHKISDVPVGSFLSSGVDSSLITKLSGVNKSFTVGFENKKYSELDNAKKLANKLQIENINKKITKKEFFDIFPLVEYYMDEPLADPSAVALYFLCNIASESVKVILSGEGADEIFGGYNIYHEPYSLSWYNYIPYPIRKTIGLLAYPLKDKRGFNFLVRRSKNIEESYIGNAFIFDTNEIKKILAYPPSNKTYKDITKPYYNKIKKYDKVSKMQYIDLNLWLPNDILLKADKMSMANSIELRVPYLDRIIVDYAKTIPTKYKIKNNQTKYLLRQVANEYLDKEIANKKKLGFPIPIREWIKDNDIYNKIKDTFKQGQEFFNTQEIIKLLEEHIEGKKDNSRKIWTIYSFLIWYKEYFIIR